MLQQGALKYKSTKKHVFLTLLNILNIPRKIIAHATDKQEADDIQLNLPKIKRINVVANYAAPVPLIFSPISKQRGQLKLIFISRISPKKNLLFLLNILKNIGADIHCVLMIRGNIEDETYWKNCREIINNFPLNIQVDIGGSVLHEEIHTLLQNNHLFVLPTFGENFGHAIFEAFAAGRPVLISDTTPWKNLCEQMAGWDIPLNNPESFLAILRQVAKMDNEAFELWCRGAWNFAKKHQENALLKEKYIELFS
jgi:glycosyltransferase involved in cell wall biosynthesis